MYAEIRKKQKLCWLRECVHGGVWTKIQESWKYTAEIDQVASHKLLGLIINGDLTYEVHVDEPCNKLSKRLGLCNLNLLSLLHKNILEGGRTFAVRTAKDWNN